MKMQPANLTDGAPSRLAHKCFGLDHSPQE